MHSTLMVHIPKELHNRLKKKCLDLSMSQREVIRRMIAIYVQGLIKDEWLHEAQDEESKVFNNKVRGMANASLYLGVSVSAIKKMIGDGRLKPIKASAYHGGVLFDKSELDKLKT